MSVEPQATNGSIKVTLPATLDCSPTIGALATALAKAQMGFQEIARSRTVTVQTRTGSSYTFAYAPLDVVLAATLPSLNANGLSLVSLPTGGRPLRLRTLLLHESGEFLAAELELPGADGPQAVGSLLTYYRRYSIVSLLGVASEEDDDGNAAEGNAITKKADKPAAPAPASKQLNPTRPWMARLQAAVAKLNLGEASAESRGLKGKVREDFVRGSRLLYLAWATGREDIKSTLDLTDDDAAVVIKKAEAGEIPS